MTIVAIAIASCGDKRTREIAELAGVEACLASVTEAAMTESCKATIESAGQSKLLSVKARAVLQRWLQLEANPVGTDSRARAARDAHLKDVQTFVVSEIKALAAAPHPD